MRFCLVLLLLFSVQLRADYDSLIATLENDPSVLIEGKVNALTRQPCIVEEDLVVQGAEPIRIIRSYAGSCNWGISNCFIFLKKDKSHEYRWTIWENGYPMIYKEGPKVRIGNEKFRRYDSSNHNKGFTNTYRGEISSRTNLKNNYFLIDDEERLLTVHAANGSIRRYKKSRTGICLFVDRLVLAWSKINGDFASRRTHVSF